MMKKLLLVFLLIFLALPACAEESIHDLTHLTEVRDKEVAALIEELSAMENLTAVDLRGVKISVDAMVQLRQELPDVTFYWQVSIGSLKVESPVQKLNLDGQKKRVGYITLNKSLKCLCGLEEVTMFDYSFSTREMQTILDDHPDVAFGWTFRLDNYRIRTDSTAFSTAKGRQDPRYTAKMLDSLKLCKDLVALDVGHNNVSDLSFIAEYWPNLKRLICIDSRTPVTDLSPLTELHDLEYIELFMQDITDLTPLANKTKLLDLNLCHNNITDLTPLYSCVNLERLHISYNPNLSQEQIDALQAALPNCVIETETYQSTGAGWREHPRYFIMKESFDTRTYIPFEQ